MLNVKSYFIHHPAKIIYSHNLFCQETKSIKLNLFTVHSAVTPSTSLHFMALLLLHFYLEKAIKNKNPKFNKLRTFVHKVIILNTKRVINTFSSIGYISYCF